MWKLNELVLRKPRIPSRASGSRYTASHSAIAIFGFAQGDTTTGLLVLFVGYPLVAALPDFFFRPLMLQSGMKMEAAILIVRIFAGIMSLGMIGFVLGPLILKLLLEALRLTRGSLADRPATGDAPG